MAKKTGLGKGLDALFSTPVVEEEKMQENDVLKNLKITEVEPNRDQPRKKFDQETLEELAESIKMYGVIQPIVVTKKDGYYSIIAGERRWRASKIAGLTEIPAIIREDDEKKNKEIALIENIQREDLNVMEVAVALKELMDIESYNVTDVAKVTGKSQSSVSNIVRLLKLTPDVQQMILDGKLVEGQARALLALDSKKRQLEIANKAIEKKLTVRDVEKLVYGSEEYVRKPEKKEPKSVYYKNLEGKLKDYFGYKVKLDYTKSHQKLIIEYDDKEGLENLLNKFNIDL